MINRDRDADITPMRRLYDTFTVILKNLTIKYITKAEQYETTDTRFAADQYFMALDKTDTYFNYQYTIADCIDVGLYDTYMQNEIAKGNLEAVEGFSIDEDGNEVTYRELLLRKKRAETIDRFEEKNNYYRMLIGYPDVEDTKYFYSPESYATQFGFSAGIPVHLIQDYYNKQDPGMGDYYISCLESVGFIKKLIEDNPDKTYLKYIGSSRISLKVARKAKNFAIIQLKNEKIRQSIYDQFVYYYEMCRDYFVKVIYVQDFKGIIEYYDNFIAMSIMVMTLQQLLVRQISLGVKREFFDIYAVKALYEAYNIPYNLYIDEETQQDIIQNLNLLIQNKATNKICYDIAQLLGFPNLSIYKYYLAKQQKFDSDGLPIIQTKEKFNEDTGETETVYDWEAMYRVYFMKEELNNQDFISTFNDATNEVPYKDITNDDPFWIEDTNLLNKLWESEYNFVESKYLGIGISYSMTDIIFENIMLLKLLMQKSDDIDDIRIKLPRITGNADIPIFDIIVLLVCLTASKHNLCGEIISKPVDLVHVMDNNPDSDWRNLPGIDIYSDALQINYSHYLFGDNRKYFLVNSLGEEVGITEADAIIQKFLHSNGNVDYEKFLVDTFQIDFDYFKSQEWNDEMIYMHSILGEDDFNKLLSYVSVLEVAGSSADKIECINQMYSNIKNLYKWLNYKISTTDNRLEYYHYKEIYNAVYYSKEMKDTFTITTPLGITRIAIDYFEYLYYRNPTLYNAIYSFDMNAEWHKYLEANHYMESQFPFEDFQFIMEDGSYISGVNYRPRFDTMKDTSVDDVNVKNEVIYQYVNHIIARLETIMRGVNYMYLLNDTATPLQTLLEKLIIFFKSFTVDMVKTDMLFVCDLKAESLLRFFDEIGYIAKWIVPKDQFNLRYADTINRIISRAITKDKLSFHDIMYYLDTLLIKENQRVRDKMIEVDGVQMYEYQYIQSLIDKMLKNQALTDEEKKVIDEVTNERIFRKHMIFAVLSDDKTTATIRNESGETIATVGRGHIPPSTDLIYYDMSYKRLFPDERILPYDNPPLVDEFQARFFDGYRKAEILQFGEWVEVTEPNTHTAYYTFDEHSIKVNYYWNGTYYTPTPVYMYYAYYWDTNEQIFKRTTDILSNSIRMKDNVIFFKTLQAKENFDLYDSVTSITSTLVTKDSLRFVDRVAKVWYDD